MPLPGDLRIGVFERRHHPRDAGLDDGIGTRRGLAFMRAWLERDVEGRALRRLLARRKASTSAWGRPPGCVQPRARMIPSLTTTAPTAGFGQVLPSPRRPSESASWIIRASKVLWSSVTGKHCQNQHNKATGRFKTQKQAGAILPNVPCHRGRNGILFNKNNPEEMSREPDARSDGSARRPLQ